MTDAPTIAEAWADLKAAVWAELEPRAERIAVALTPLAEWITPPPRAVLWGGRPGLDYQVGSFRDRRRQMILRMSASMVRVGRAFTEAAEVLTRTATAFAAVQRAHHNLAIVSEADERRIAAVAMRQPTATLKVKVDGAGFKRFADSIRRAQRASKRPNR